MAKAWSDLPIEILSKIFSRLSLLDCLRFRSVCSNWHSSLPHYKSDQTQSKNPTPWLMLFGEDFTKETIHALFNPSSKELYPIKFPELRSAQCLSSRNGWLLVLARLRSCIFFLNPFSGARIDVPYQEGYMDSATFSESPTSPNCVIIAVCDCGINSNLNGIKISVCRRGDTKWTGYNFASKNFSMIKDVAFHGGNFYCLDSFGRVGAFNTRTNAWVVLTPRKCPAVCNAYLVGSIGGLFVGVGARYGAFQRLFKLVLRPPTIWTEVTGLENGVFFLGPNSSCVSLEGNQKKVFTGGFYGDCKCCLYDLGGNQEREVVLVCPQFDWCYTPIWIEPDWVVPSTGLKWSLSGD